MEKESKKERQAFIFFGFCLWLLIILLIDKFYFNIQSFGTIITMMILICAFFMVMVEVEEWALS